MTKYFTVTDAAQRPARMDGRCFYCNRPIGDRHTKECVLVKKKVLVRAIIEYEVEAPADWDAAKIEFHRNDSSWCVDNMVGELDALTDGRCLCQRVTFTHLVDTSGPYLDER